MRPDLIKLAFARETAAHLVAEGVETEAELAMLPALVVDLVQGYLLGRPAALEALDLTASHAARA